MSVTIQIQGLDRIKKKLRDIPENIKAEVDAEMSSVANDFVNRAVADAPVNFGTLRGEITFERLEEMNYVVVSGANYSAFIEFGTRSKVQVPAELQAYASQFRNSGSSKGAKEAIFLWCKRKGIDEKYWYSIFLKIMTVGITPHPFFFKQLPEAQAQLNKNLKAVVQRALSR